MTGILLLATPPPTIIQANAPSFLLSPGAASFSQTSPSGTLSLTGPAFALTPGAATFSSGSGLQINIIFDPTVSSAPSGWTTDIQTAASLLMAAAPQTNCTVNIGVGYGVVPGGGGTAPTNSSAGGVTAGGSGFYSYTAVKAAMVANNKSAAMNTLISSLPSGSTFRGSSTTVVNGACAKALGLIANNSTVDGNCGFGTGLATTGSGGVLVGVALHEISHAMGRVPDNLPFETFRYLSAGVYNNDDTPPARASYFSLDGGVTKLADFDTNSDPSDFLNQPDGTGVQDAGLGGNMDPFDAFYAGNTLQTITTIGGQLLNCLGFQ